MLAALQKRSSYTWSGAICLALVFLSVNLGYILFIQDKHVRMVASDITFPVVNLFAAGALFLAYTRTRAQSKKMGAAWLILTIAQFSFALGDIIWGTLEAGLGQEAFPSTADFFYLAFYLLFLIGILHLPTKRLSPKEWFKRFLDMAIIMVAAGIGFWNFLLGPLSVQVISDPFLTQALSLAYPVGDLLLLWALLFLLYRRPQNQSSQPLIFLMMGVLAMILTDCIFSYQSLVGTYISGGFLDLGWIVAYLFFGLAGVSQALQAQIGDQASPELEPQSRNFLNDWIIYLPYAGLVAAYLLLLISHTTPLPMQFSDLGLAVGVVIGLVLARQVIALRENRDLTGRLYGALTEVQSQAAILSKTNVELEGEIKERKRMEVQLSHDALHDALTGLPNRVLFADRLGRAIEYSKRNYHSFSMLFLDLDHFKVVNDSLGHPVGDQLLIAISQRLRACLRSTDTVARFGGDEFVILIENSNDLEAVTGVANRIQEELKLPFYLGEHKVYISASIGIITSVQEYDKPEEILRDADIAMYEAKALGKGRFEIFDTHLRQRAIDRLEIEDELRHALECKEFEMYYQPIQALQSNDLIGFEALIRWNHPTRGLLLPADFLPVAEETGLILPISRWVLQEACTQTRAWQDQYPMKPAITINVNISGKQFTQLDFVDQIRQVLQETGISPTSLKLEITENLLIDNPDAACGIFDRLNELGVQLQIDDFGTGYSALSYLQRFPIQTIKIDRSFIGEVGKDGKPSGLVQTIILMARDLGMEATAEGIENEQQLAVLRQLGCNYGQGFLFSKPLETSKVGSLFERIYPTEKKADAIVDCPSSVDSLFPTPCLSAKAFTK